MQKQLSLGLLFAETVNKSNYISAKTEVDGDTHLKVSARLVSIQTGQILSAPTASADETGVLGKSSASLIVQGVGSRSGSANANAALAKLVDKAVADVTDTLSKKIAAAPIAQTAAAAVVVPKFVGIEDGLVVINKGTNAGIHVGDSFVFVRPTDTGLKDPDSGAAIVRKKKLCTLVILSVEDGISSGKCDGSTPEKGDELSRVGGL